MGEKTREVVPQYNKMPHVDSVMYLDLDLLVEDESFWQTASICSKYFMNSPCCAPRVKSRLQW